MNYISDKTSKSYSKIIFIFIIFSPSVYQDDIDELIKSKFNLWVEFDKSINKNKGTALKYNNCISSFLKIIYNRKIWGLYG